jgi:hypothetical protein
MTQTVTQAHQVLGLGHPQLTDFIGRGGVIRTRDPLRPRQVRYQAALRPDSYYSFNSRTLALFFDSRGPQ